jgi:hypothetical protein
VTWAIENKGYTQRRACGLVGMEPRVYRYRSSRPDDTDLRKRLRELAAERRLQTQSSSEGARRHARPHATSFRARRIQRLQWRWSLGFLSRRISIR